MRGLQDKMQGKKVRDLQKGDVVWIEYGDYDHFVTVIIDKWEVSDVELRPGYFRIDVYGHYINGHEIIFCPDSLESELYVIHNKPDGCGNAKNTVKLMNCRICEHLCGYYCDGKWQKKEEMCGDCGAAIDWRNIK